MLNNQFTGNMLPYDGEVIYLPSLLAAEDASLLYNELLDTIDWTPDEVVIYGRHITTKREVAWYAEDEIAYKYSGLTRPALPFNGPLLQLKSVVEKICGETFNGCLLNLYHNGGEGMGWHSDNEKTIVPLSTIASVSLGAPRRFLLRHKKNRETVEILLNDGSLLLMKGECQLYWQHALPVAKKVTGSRINLTFRSMVK